MFFFWSGTILCDYASVTFEKFNRRFFRCISQKIELSVVQVALSIEREMEILYSLPVRREFVYLAVMRV